MAAPHPTTEVDGFAACMAGNAFAAPCSTVTIVDPDWEPVEDGPEGLMAAPTEQIVWRDAATGTELARSGNLPRMSHGILVTPIFDGRFFELGHQGTLTELTLTPPPPAPKPSMPTTAPS